jgi:branched-chain amino acid transport system ATP-binding protein
MAKALLQVDSASKNFGGLTALSKVTLTVEEGSISSLIGPNGAGKSTLFNTITNLIRLDSGSMYFEGERFDQLAPHMIAGRGIQRTFQLLQVCKELTVLENVALGMHAKGSSGFLGAILRFPSMRLEEAEIIQQSKEAVRFVGLEAQLNVAIGQLPYGQQKLVELARAIVSGPKLLLLDEPTNGLSPSETQRLNGMLEQLRNRGVTIFLVAHDMQTVMKVSDKIFVLNFGEKIAEGTPREIAENQEVIKAYLGKEYVIA